MEIEINDMDLWASSVDDLSQMKQLNKQLDDLLAKEEIILHQWSRAIWQENGDMNINFFTGRPLKEGKLI